MSTGRFICTQLISKEIGLISLANESKMNALNSSMLSEFAESLETFSKNSSVKCIIIKGEGKNFSVGMDLNELPVGKLIPSIEACFKSAKKPIIAAVNGYAVLLWPFTNLI